jgi:hypothetical protein
MGSMVTRGMNGLAVTAVFLFVGAIVFGAL